MSDKQVEETTGDLPFKIFAEFENKKTVASIMTPPLSLSSVHNSTEDPNAKQRDQLVLF
jgi:hypothetical protein